MTDLIDPEGRCERCGRLVPIECPEPDGLSCGTYVLTRHRAQHHDTMQRLRAMLPPSPRDGETSIGYEPANDAGPPPDLDVPPDEPCPDCDGTGWASESNPGTGGTGRDERIAVECPRGCRVPYTVTVDGAANGYDPHQEPLSPARASLGSDGRITTVYPNGESYTDPTRLPPANEAPDTPEETAFFAAMDDLVEHVTGSRPGARGCEADDQGPEDPAF